MKKFYTLLLICAAGTGYSQQGFGTSNPAPSSVIDMVASNKGALLPRIALTSTAVAAPVTAPANALTVFNTATAGDVTPGYYYWSTAATKWIKLIATNDLQEPWKVQATTNNATLNTDNIYQQGKVAIGTTSATAVSTHQLDVTGDFKTKYTDGTNYYGMESYNNDLGIPMNLQYVANTIDPLSATQLSSTVLRPGVASIQSAYGNGSGSIATFGNSTGGTVAMSATNSTADVTSSLWANNSTSSNVTLSHSKTTAEATSITLEKLTGVSFNFNKVNGTAEGSYTFPRNNGTANQVLITDGTNPGNAQLSWKDISTLLPATTNTLTAASGNLVSTVNGVASTPAVPVLISANNGLTAASGNVKLGGALTAATTITTTAANTLTLAGLQAGLTTDNVVVSDAATGVLKTVAASALASSTEPWYNVATNTQATANTQDIYQNGKIGIGFSNPTYNLEVGDFLNNGAYFSLSQTGVNANGQTSLTYFTKRTGNNSLTNATSRGFKWFTLSDAYVALPGLANSLFLESWSDGTRVQNIFVAKPNGYIGTGIQNPTNKLHIKPDTGLDPVRIEDFQAGALTDNIVVATTTGVLKTVATNSVASLLEPWQIQGGTTKATTNAQNIYQTGTVAIATSTIPSFTSNGVTITPKFHVAGDVSTTGAFYTTTGVYADYVFEKYFDGHSKIDENYSFKSLAEVNAFIKKNKHLPGVTPISDINKTATGYSFDISKLSMQSLEKIEELYLHTIEQQAVIEKQQVEIRDMKARLERLENILLEKK